MGHIPKAKAKVEKRIKTPESSPFKDDTIKFSFARVETNEFFGLDCTCDRWAKDLFDVMKTVSEFRLEDVYAGCYSGKNSRLRIHTHQKAIPPCEMPENVDLSDMWQIRISKSKGGIHGIFIENVFYVIWFDPLHNLYPDENYGGLKKIRHVNSCCNDREEEWERICEENIKLKQENESLMDLLDIKTS